MAFIQLLDNQKEKGWNLVVPRKEAVLNFYLTRPQRFRVKTRPKLVRKIEETNALYERLRGYSSDLRLINTALVTMDLSTLSCNQEHIAKAMFNGCIVRAFESSASGFSGDIEDRLCNLILYVTGLPVDDSQIDLLQSIYDHPYSSIIGKFVEQAYIDVMKKAYDFDTLYGGN